MEEYTYLNNPDFSAFYYDEALNETESANYADDGHQLFLYQGYAFERVIYLYIWEILVIATCLLNIVVISILLQKKLRSQTYMILVAISISDSLTGLVTLPTYIDVFQQYSPGTVSESTDLPVISSVNISHLPPGMQDYIDKIRNMEPTKPANLPTEGYLISEGLCDGFMISKFFVSKTFHTVSVWLTLFLGTLRFLSVYSPMRKQTGQLTVRRTIVVCIAMFILAPFLHIYHLFKDKSIHGNCKWTVEMGKDCGSDCVYFWFALLFGHLLPAIALTAFTIYFVYSLQKTTHALRNTESEGNDRRNTTLLHRERENRRVSVLVVAIVVVFLIAELPYACFLFYGAVSAHANIAMNLEFNRAIHAAYEVVLVLSFNANFYIYTFFNKRFRRAMKRTIFSPIFKTLCPKVHWRSSIRRSSKTSSQTTGYKMSTMKTTKTSFSR